MSTNNDLIHSGVMHYYYADVTVITNNSQARVIAILKFLKTFKEEEPILLVEMGGVFRLSSDIEAATVNLIGLLRHAQVVVSLSSGTGNFISLSANSSFKKFFNNHKISPTAVDFRPFTETEALLFMQEYKLSIDNIEEYEKLTNFNPSLLFACCNHEDAKIPVGSMVAQYVEELRASLVANDFYWVYSSLPFCMEMLHFAYNGLMVASDKQSTYMSSWLYAEKITYITSQNDSGFMLAVNFPQIYDELMDMLWQNRRKENVQVHNTIINGYQFEKRMCNTIKLLDCVYSHQEVSGVHPVQCEIKFCIKMEANQPVTELEPGVLYQLRPSHPVIDAVLYVEKSDRVLLFLIQVSISTYSIHDSKAGDLKNTITGCELTNKGGLPCNWLDYYKCLPKKCRETKEITCIYLYLSPNELYSGGGEDPASLLKDLGTKSHTSDLFLGLITYNTECSSFVQEQYREVCY
jgi:hypothetical protein